MFHRPHSSHLALGLLAAGALAPRVASAQFIDRLSLHLEGGVSSTLEDNQSINGVGLGAVGALRVGIDFLGPLAFQVSGNLIDLGGQSANSPPMFGTVTGGLRLEPLVRYFYRPFIDANIGAAFIGPELSPRLAWDAGLGVDIHVAGPLFIGPVARIGQITAASTDAWGSNLYWSLALSVGFHAYQPPPRPRPRDADRDGVIDARDLCRTVPAGDHPDPHRLGCPDGDDDHDGVLNAQDQCLDVPAGDHPDPARPGCPLGDRDHDGVFDPDDQCPDTPAGDHPDPHRPGCPDGDDDHDGVLNAQDQCPSVPAGDHPDQHRPGCPIPDRDGDTVPDDVDHCPDQPGAPSPDPMRNGCPGLVQISGGQVHINRPVFFATNRDTILPPSFPVLQAVADALRATPAILRIAIEGHTDNVGPEAHNMELSQHRAEAVMHWLIAHEVAAGRLEAHGYGPSRPIAPNTTVAGRAINRRVEFHIVDPAPPAGSSPVVTPPAPEAPVTAHPAAAHPTRPVHPVRR